MNRRVVVTGLGMVSGLGHDAVSSWRAALAGCSGIARLTAYDTSQQAVKVAAEVKNWIAARMMDAREARRTDRHQQFALVAAAEAMRQSGLAITDANRERISVLVASSTGGMLTYDENMKLMNEHGARRVNPFGILMFCVNGAAALISIAYGAQGPSFAVVSSCATGADNIGQAFKLIRDGSADAAIAGGADTPVTEMGVAVLDRINVLSHVCEPPEASCAPFDSRRSGLVLGEGAGIMVLEALDHARARGATILAEVAGYGASADAYHVAAPDEDGVGGALAMKRALTDAQMNPCEVSYVNAHGTGTRANDLIETRAMKRAFGEAAYQVAISSTKPMTGHAMGATAALEAVFCVQAIQEGAIPPTLNLHDPDPACDLDYTPLTARRMLVRAAMTNALGLGGHNASLIFKVFAL